MPVDSGDVCETQAEALGMSVGRLCLVVCRAWGSIWNMAFDPGLVSYGRRYDPSMHYSPT